jgi:hypothetical protein
MADSGSNLTKQPTAAEIRQAFNDAQGGISSGAATTIFVSLTIGILLMLALSALWGSAQEGDLDERQGNVIRTVVTFLIVFSLLFTFIGVTTVLSKS